VRQILTVPEIVQSGLCIGCGLCQSLAGADKLRLVMTPEGRERPREIAPLEDEEIQLINAVCPGLRAGGPGPEGAEAFDPVWGRKQGPWLIGWAGDPEIRFRAATGGVLTALGQFLLASGKVEKLLHVRPREDAPLRTRAQVSETPAQVAEGLGSRYGPGAPLTEVERLLDEGAPFAVIAKPCDLTAIANLARQDPRVDELIPYRLCMVCGGASEATKFWELFAGWGIDEAEVSLMRYRGHGNPGKTHVETRDGRVFETSYQELWEDEAKWRLQFRCKVCPDAIGELADIAASDVWPGGAPAGEDEGFNGLLTRTPRGAALLEEAMAAGYIVTGEEIGFRDMDDFQPHQVRKKKAVWARLTGLRAAGWPSLETFGLRIAELARGVSLAENLRQARGARQRLRDGKVAEPQP
jgi:coenzyme F420 hydrogenase subunit beta